MKKLYFAYFKHILIIFGIFILITVGFSIAFYTFIKLKDEKLEMPNVTSVSMIDAMEVLQQKGLKPFIISQASNDIPMFFVISQETPPGFTIKKGREIALTVSIGPSWLELPDFTGKNVYEITSYLEAIPKEKRKFIVKEINWVNSSEPFGAITSQYPKKQKVTDKLIEIKLWASTGESRKMPALGGLFLEEALAVLNKEGLKNKIIYKETEDSKADGKIAAQIPEAGKKLSLNPLIQLTVFKLKNKKKDFAVLDYTIPDELNRVKIRISYFDNRGKTILFEGWVNAGESVIRTMQTHGVGKCYLYKLENDREVFVKELEI